MRIYWAANNIRHILENFDPDNSNKQAVMDAFILGYVWGLRRTLDPENKLLELLLNYYHSKKSGDIVFAGRHAGNEGLYKEALAYAQNSWEEDDEMMHHKMVEHILNEVEMFKELNKETLLKRIKPIALKFDRFWDPSQKMKLKDTK